MKNFLKMVFASALGVALGSILLVCLFIFLMFTMVISSAGSSKYVPEKNSILKLELNGILNDRVVSNPFAELMGDKIPQQSLTDVINAIKKAKENENIRGIYIKNQPAFSAGTASLEAIRKSLLDFKESGKFIVSYGDSYTQSGYYVSSVADEVFLNPQGIIDLHGLAAMPTFYTGLLEKLGVKMQIFKVGTFKSAVEPYMLDKMSEANREQVTSYVGNIWENVSSSIALSRNYEVDSLNALINKGVFLLPAEKIMELGLADSLLYLSEMEDYFEKRLDKENLSIALVSDMKSVPFKDKKKHNEKIAVLYAEGEITDASTGFFPSNSVITDKEYVEELKKLKEDEDVKAVVFRINSPGGSGFMSEQIWREVVELKKEKPIIVSMGDVAASGGYYIACASDWIVAQPTTITGSIGVFGMFPNFEDLYGKIGLSSDVVKTNTYSDFGDLSRAMRKDEMVLMQNYVEQFYDVFLERCADGRGKTKAQIDSIGQGRVWTGEQAISLGLVDELGGLDRAIEIAAERAGLDKYSLVQYPADKGAFAAFLDLSSRDVKMHITKGILDDTEFRHLLLVNNLKKQDKLQARLPFE